MIQRVYILFCFFWVCFFVVKKKSRALPIIRHRTMVFRWEALRQSVWKKNHGGCYAPRLAVYVDVWSREHTETNNNVHLLSIFISPSLLRKLQ